MNAPEFMSGIFRAATRSESNQECFLSVWAVRISGSRYAQNCRPGGDGGHQVLRNGSKLSTQPIALSARAIMGESSPGPVASRLGAQSIQAAMSKIPRCRLPSAGETVDLEPSVDGGHVTALNRHHLPGHQSLQHPNEGTLAHAESRCDSLLGRPKLSEVIGSEPTQAGEMQDHACGKPDTRAGFSDRDERLYLRRRPRDSGSGARVGRRG